MTMSRRARAALVLSMLTGTAFLSTGATAAPGSPWREVTDSSRGRAAAISAANQFADSGVPTRTSDLRVFDVADGDLLVLPRWVEPASVLRREVVANGRIATEVEASLLIGLAARNPAGRSTASLDGQLAGVSTAAAAYWYQYNSGCFKWLRKDGAYMAPCFYTSKLMNDGSSTRDYFSLRQKASVGSSSAGSATYDAWLLSKRTSGSTTQWWEDWEPGGELRGNCGSVTLSVSVKGVGVGISSTACERWEPTLWEDAGHFRNKWNCDCWFGVTSMREVASNIAVSVPQGKYPRWTISAGFTTF